MAFTLTAISQFCLQVYEKSGLWSVFGNNALAFLIARGYSLYGKSKDVINYSNLRCKHKPKASGLDAKF